MFSSDSRAFVEVGERDERIWPFLRLLINIIVLRKFLSV